MKKTKILSAILFLIVIFIAQAQAQKQDFFGMWTIKIEDGRVGWLNVHESEGFLDAELLWRGGSVLPVSHVYFTDDNTLTVTRTQERKKGDERTHTITQAYTFVRNGNNISGVAYLPSPNGMNVREEKFYGWKLPEVGPAPDLSTVEYGKPVKLFNGKNLDGWTLMGESRKNGFKVVDGVLVNDPEEGHGRYGNLRSDAVFEDFKLNIEVNVPAHSNSGIYLRGMYEIQVLDSYGMELDSHHMGGLYSRVAPSKAAEKPAGEWQKMEIILCERHVTVILNGQTIIDNQPAHGPTGGAILADVFKPGPIYLQGDHGKVSFKNIVLTPIVN